MTFLAALAIGLLFNAPAAAAAAWKRSLTPWGAVTGTLIGAIIFACGGLAFWAVMAVFFLSSTALGFMGRAEKALREAVIEKSGRRDSLQVLANGGVAAAAAVAWRLTGEPAWAFAFAAAFASCNADTWASEIGVLARRPPVSLLGFRPVPAGISGGVSLLGTGASLAGALLIAIGVVLVYRGTGRVPLPRPLSAAALITACGVVGSLADSFLGAGVQAQYTVPSTGTLTERRASRDGPHVLVRGNAFVTNDVVNFASSVAAAAAGGLLYRFVA